MKLNQRVHLASQTNARAHTGRLTGLTAKTFTVTWDSKYMHEPRNKEDVLVYNFGKDQGKKIKGGTQTYQLYQLTSFKLGV